MIPFLNALQWAGIVAFNLLLCCLPAPESVAWRVLFQLTYGRNL